MIERSLWAAVLQRAFGDIAGFFIDPKLSEEERREIQIEALEWLYSDEKQVGSVVWIADLLDLEVETVREFYEEGNWQDFAEMRLR